MFLRSLALVFSFIGTLAYAQRVLTSPDLSTFTTGGIPSISVDATTGWIYASGFNSRAMGLTRFGMARVTGDGVIDGGWQPTGLHDVFSHVVASNGDLYVHGWEAASGPKVIARYSPAGSALPVAIYRAGAIENDPNSGIGMMFGNRGRYVYFTDNNSVSVTVGRIDTKTGLVDSTWSYFTSQQIFDISQGAGADAPLFILEQQYPGLDRDLYLRRLDSVVAGTVLWTKTYAPGDASIAADDSAHVYLMRRAGFSSRDITIERLTSTGNVDLLWNGQGASSAVSQSSWNRRLYVVDNTLVLPVYVDPTSSDPGRTMLIRFDRSGVETARWASVLDGRIQSVFDGRNGRIYVSVNRSLQVLDTSTLQPLRTLSLTFGSLGQIRSVLALPDGGRLFLGTFDVWYGGQRFQNILRTHADGTPHTGWRVEIDGAAGSATVTPLGLLLVGNFTRVNGIARSGAALLSLSAAATVADWSPAVPLNERVFTFDGKDTVYFIGYSGGIHRMALSSGLVDNAWNIAVDKLVGQRPSGLGVDSGDGVWLFRDSEDGFGGTTEVTSLQRFDIASRQSTLFTPADGSQRFVRSLLSTGEHVYIGNIRYRLADGGQPDTSWQPSRGAYYASPPQTIAGGYLYFFDYGDGGVVSRASLTGNGQTDPSWTARVTQTMGCVNPDVPLFVVSPHYPMTDAEFLIRCRDDLPPLLFARSAGSMALATSRNDANADKTVVEYFNRDINRYFVTGRSNEQALLDAQPAVFVRTGMQFRARGSTYRDILETPVCRFYAAPAQGGSNTHFYGTGDDCPVLNTASHLRFEGFDFAAVKPTNSACTGEAANPVWRLFNNKAATNDGNHRYVVSAATKARMVAQGWVDEGVVFCSTGVTDAAN